MANEATEKFLQNAPRIIWLLFHFSMGFIISMEMTEDIDGRLVPVIYEDSPGVFRLAVFFFLIAFLTAHCVVLLFIHENLFTKVCRWCCVVSFALGVCLLFLCRILSSAILIGSSWQYEEL